LKLNNQLTRLCRHRLDQFEAMAREQFARLSMITLAALRRRKDGSGPINLDFNNKKITKPA